MVLLGFKHLTPHDLVSKEGQCGQEVMLLVTYLTEDLSSFLILLHVQGAEGDPGSSLGEAVVVGLVLIL